MQLFEYVRERPWVPALVLVAVVVAGAAGARIYASVTGGGDPSDRFGLNFEGAGRPIPGVLEVDALHGTVCTTFDADWATTAQIHYDGEGSDPVVVTVFEPPSEPLPRTCARGVSPGILLEVIRHPGDYYMNLEGDDDGGRSATSELD